MQVDQSSSNEATQQILLEALPPILVLHLERFLYDVTTASINKISKPVKFGPELEIPLGMTFPLFPGPTVLRISPLSVGPEIMAPAVGKSAEPVRYKLHGVLYHQGESAGGGHYTVDVLYQNGDSGGGEAWLHIDDEAVSAARHEDVFGDNEMERVDDPCAYMLFYCRTSSSA